MAVTFAELEKNAADYLAEKAAKQEPPFPLHPINYSNRNQIPSSQMEDYLIAEHARLKAILGDLGVEEALEAVKKDVWGEHIVCWDPILISVGHPLAKVNLYSDLIPSIQITNLGINKSFEKVCLSVSIKSTTGTPNSTKLLLRDRLPEMLPDIPLIKKLMTPKDLSGLYNYCLRSVGKYVEYPDPNINLDDPESVRQFQTALVEIVNRRRSTNTLPDQLRSWSESVIAQFPPQLNTTGHLTKREITEWRTEWMKEMDRKKFIQNVLKATPFMFQ